ncbi:hypothetical protein [Luteitalea sp.]|uniref:RNA polymerase sigma factor n=1 Tax=Luteitalea sp. TaxID=2004800 RepID=UPI0025B8DB2F|nr:hypothetical protein [Luteitalea sp.]
MRARPPSDGIDSPAFSSLLARLDPDSDRAGVAYEQLRRALCRFFDWRAVAAADEAADDVLDRLARRLAAGEPVQDVRSFAMGIARLVSLEYHRRPEARAESLDPAVADRVVATLPAVESDGRDRCFDRCFGDLPADVREVMVRYYGGTGRTRIEARAALARDLGVSQNALRLRAQRVRDRLEQCMRRCLAGTPQPGNGATL